MCGDRHQPADTMCARCQGRWFDVYLTTSEATVRSLSRTLIWCLLDNERSDCALVVKDVDLMFTWQRAKRLCARWQGRWFDVYLTTSEATVRSLTRTLIWCLLDNERSDFALVVKDVDLMFTWQRARRLCARCQGRWFDVYLTRSEETVPSLSRTLIWCLLDNERSDCALVVKDIDLMFTWQRAKRLCARCQGRWFDVYLTTSAQSRRSLSANVMQFTRCVWLDNVSQNQK